MRRRLEGGQGHLHQDRMGAGVYAQKVRRRGAGVCAEE